MLNVSKVVARATLYAGIFVSGPAACAYGVSIEGGRTDDDGVAGAQGDSPTGGTSATGGTLGTGGSSLVGTGGSSRDGTGVVISSDPAGSSGAGAGGAGASAGGANGTGGGESTTGGAEGTAEGISVTYAAHPDARALTGDNKVIPMLSIENGGAASVPLSQIEVRYYFTKDSVYEAFIVSFEDPPHIERGEINLDLEGMAEGTVISTAGGGVYVEITIGGTAENLKPGDKLFVTPTIRSQNWQCCLDQDNDYSFHAGSDPILWEKITVHQDATLVWGIAP